MLCFTPTAIPNAAPATTTALATAIPAIAPADSGATTAAAAIETSANTMAGRAVTADTEAPDAPIPLVARIGEPEDTEETNDELRVSAAVDSVPVMLNSTTVPA